MIRRLRSYGVPILAKELIEQAARKRTYTLRVLYIGALFLLFFIVYGPYYWRDVQSLLGSGRSIFQCLVFFQMVTAYALLPPGMAGAIAHEKERGSLSILLLTRLRPGEIILGKLISHLVPFVSLQLATLPLLAIAYGLGGITLSTFWCGAYLSMLTCLQVGSFTLMLSSYCYTSKWALVWTYAGGAGCCVLSSFVVFTIRQGFTLGTPAALLPSFCPPLVFLYGNDGHVGDCVLQSLPALISVPSFLLVARWILVRRATVCPTNFRATLLTFLDVCVDKINRLFGNILLWRDQTLFPGEEPVAWLETRRKSLGTLRYRVGIVLLTEIPVVGVVVACLYSDAMRGSWFFMNAGLIVSSITIVALFVVSAVVLGVLGVHAITTERSDRTLAVLLTTPLPRRDILLQKFRGVMQFGVLLWMPFVTIFLFNAWWTSMMTGWDIAVILYLVTSALLVLVYQPILVYLSFLFALRGWSRPKTLLAYFGAVAAWAVLPALVSFYMHDGWVDDVWEGFSYFCIVLLGPAALLPELHSLTPHESIEVGFVRLFNAAIFYFFVLKKLRRVCLESAEDRLPRLL